MSRTIHCDWPDCKTQSEIDGGSPPSDWAVIQWTTMVKGTRDETTEMLKSLFKGMGKALDGHIPPELGFIPVLTAHICPRCLGEFIHLDKFAKDPTL